MPDFVHLHCHTAYSLLDGAIRLDDLIRKTSELKMTAVAMTDHGNMFGAVNFYQSAKKAGLNPIMGCEVYVAPGDRRDTEYRPGQPHAYHLVLLAQNLTGYYNLINLVSRAYLEGFYYRPRIDLPLLKEYSEGLIALSACLQGQVPGLLLRNQVDEAFAAAQNMANIMGPQNFYLELQRAGLPEQKGVNSLLQEFAGKLKLGLVASNDCHFLNRHDSEAHDALICIQTGKMIADQDRMTYSPELYFKSPEEMAEIFSDVPETLSSTAEIAQRCAVDLPLGKHRFPRFPLPEKQSAEEVLQTVAREGLQKRFQELRQRHIEFDEETYLKRQEYELGVLIQTGFAGYFLVVADFINWAKDRHIPVGPGRGSAAGSLVAWAMRITDLDPVRYSLIFERFINTERVSLPDIDVDFCYNRRSEVLEYVSQTYGREHVAQIITFGSMQAKGVIRDVGRVLSMPYSEVDQIAKLVPTRLGITLKQALEAEPRLAELRRHNPEVAKLLEIAMALEGLPRHASTHAAGVVIGDEPLRQIVPLYRGPEGELVTQFDMKCVEKAGLIKFDFLGLRTLTVIDVAVDMVRKNHNPDFSIDDISMGDAETFALLCRGDAVGVFQLESSGMKELLVKLKPACFEDIIALVALYRPGPLESGMVDDFIGRKHGHKKVEYLLPQLAPILKETYGVIVYQEQVMEIARTLASYSLGEGDILRRAMGKKDPAEMAGQQKRFLQGAAQNKIDPKIAKQIFDLMEKFAGYGFNKSHSAAYALIAYQTAYLKAHFPYEFMAALLTSEMTNTDAIQRHISECREQQLAILPPDINQSGRDFTVQGQAIRVGLATIKNVGLGAVDAIIQARESGGPFKDLYDFCERADISKINRKALESLIKAGALDSLAADRIKAAARPAVLACLEEAIQSGQKARKDRESGQFNMFADLAPAPEQATHILPLTPPWAETYMLSQEKSLLGFYISGHPLDSIRSDIKRLSNLDTATIQEASDEAIVSLVGLPAEIKEKITKKGDRMAFITLEDLVGSVEVIAFPDCYAKAMHFINSETPVLVTGSIDKDERGAKIRAAQIMPLDQAAHAMTTCLKLTVNIKSADRAKLINLRQTLAGNPGPCRVLLNLRQEGKGWVSLDLPRQYRVDPGPKLIADLSQLLGPNAVESVYNGNGA